MEFEIIPESTNSEQSAEEDCTPSDEERSVIRAHRAIVAGQCDWFRRALLSGMREAIDK